MGRPGSGMMQMEMQRGDGSFAKKIGHKRNALAQPVRARDPNSPS
jgi:hypothetical protein